jgi:uncharacterized protein YeeX (DUF496 family)
MNYEKLNMEIEEMTEQYEKKIDDYEETKIGKWKHLHISLFLCLKTCLNIML